MAAVAAPRRGRAALAVAALVALGATGCGSDEEPAASGAGELRPSDGARLSYALPERPRTLDPLLASSRSERVVARQIHEPLTDELEGPYGELGTDPGIARAVGNSADRTIWRFRLRRGVRFQDGTELDAAAVLANVRRWLTTARGRAELPELEAADTPAPRLVRLVLASSVEDLPERLAAGRLGLVSPRALRPRDGTGARLTSEERTGTGPFELRERTDDRILLARNTGWWGTRHDLGPGLDQIELPIAPSEAERLRMLEDGDAQVASALDAATARPVRRDPLLTVVGGPDGGRLGVERSVRGIPSANPDLSLSGVWLSVVGQG